MGGPPLQEGAPHWRGRRAEVVAMLGVLLAVLELVALIASPFAFFEIITKAG